MTELNVDSETVYDDRYFSDYHTRTSKWIDLFNSYADLLLREVQPGTVLDAGCARGLLVEALRDRGVEAFGVDVSPHAISQVREDIRPYCWVGSIADPFPRRYDLILSFEVVEHLTKEDGRRAIKNFCEFSDDVLLSTAPDVFNDTTHINVQPVEYWAKLFAEHGFWHDLDFDASFISPWAMRFRRSRDPLPRLVESYERKMWRLSRELVALRAAGLAAHIPPGVEHEWHPVPSLEPSRVSGSLQRDFGLPSVRTQEAPGVPGIFWSAGLGATPVLPTDPRPLDLFLHSPNAVSWTVAFPADAEGAEFRSAVAISQAAPEDPTADGVEFAVYVTRADEPEERVFGRRLTADERSWQPFVVPLDAYAGQTVTLHLTSDGVGNLAQDWAMYRHPTIELGGEPAGSVAEDPSDAAPGDGPTPSRASGSKTHDDAP